MKLGTTHSVRIVSKLDHLLAKNDIDRRLLLAAEFKAR